MVDGRRWKRLVRLRGDPEVREGSHLRLGEGGGWGGLGG